MTGAANPNKSAVLPGLRPYEQLRQAIDLLANDGQRSEGLRLTIHASLRQQNWHRALQASSELVERSDCIRADHALHAKVLLSVRREAEALAWLKKTNALDECADIAAMVHVVMGDMAAARKAALLAINTKELDEDELRQLKWVLNYAAAVLGRKCAPQFSQRWINAAPVADGDVPVFAVFDYKAPERERSSINIGDWMQTLAAMRHLARLEGVEWSYDDPRLAAVMARLRATWADHELVNVAGRAHLAIMDRDFPLSASLRFPNSRVWVLGNAWYAHKVFGASRAWPAPEGIEPLLVSVHIAHAIDLSPDRLDWLASRGPVGCRDQATLAWLKNQGVDAYLSGCLTMTLATASTVKSDENLWVDMDDCPREATAVAHLDRAMRRSDFVSSLTVAADFLDRYAAAESVHTSRLHCALPARAVGARVHIAASQAADPRFDGLFNLDDAQFTKRANDLCALMADVLPDIVRQAPVEEIRAKLRGHAGLSGPQGGRRPTFTPQVKQGSAVGQVTVAIACDSNYLAMARTLLKSVRAHTTARIRVVMLTRGVTDDQARRAAALAEPFDVRVLEMDGELDGIEVELLEQITISTMDRLYLAKLLPDLDRVIYIDCDTLVRGDIAELGSFEPGSSGLAVRHLSGVRNVAAALERRAKTMAGDKASVLREWAAANSDLAAPMFNAGVLVMSLNTIRELGIDDDALDLVRRFGLNDQDALNLVAAGRTAALPGEWNTLSTFDLCNNPKLMHWTGRAKPWKGTPVALKQEWQEAYSAAGSPMNKAYWADPSSYQPEWAGRAEMAAAWFPDAGRVADIGCGAPMALRDVLAEDVDYVPADLTAWTNQVIKIDLDELEFPDGQFAAVAMLGVLEYLKKPGLVLLKARSATDNLVISYCHPVPGSGPELRMARGWINAYHEDKFPTFMKRFGWAIDDQKLFDENEGFRQIIYRCASCERVIPPPPGPIAK